MIYLLRLCSLRYFVAGILSLLSLALSAQVNQIALQVAGQTVTLEELQFAYQQNKTLWSQQQPMSLKSYTTLYADLKRKVGDAKALGLDTLASFRQEYQDFRNLQLRSYLVDSLYIDSVAYHIYREDSLAMQGEDKIRLKYIYFHLPQRSGTAYALLQQHKADSLYQRLTAGADFDEVAKQNSEGNSSMSQAGELPWIHKNTTSPRFEKVIYALSPGKISRPFKTEAGIYIVKILNRQALGTYAQNRDSILFRLKGTDIAALSVQHRLADLVKQGGESRYKAVMDSLSTIVLSQHPTLRYVLQAYYDGLLAYAVSQQQVWQKATTDTIGIESFFQKHAKLYRWDRPRYRGYVIQAKDKKIGKQVRKWLKRQRPYSSAYAAEAVSRYRTPKIPMTQVAYGLYAEGENTIIDLLYFKVKNKQIQVNTQWPYMTILGKKMKGPASWQDVKTDVLADYQKELENEWLHTLRNRYEAKINNNVLTDATRQ